MANVFNSEFEISLRLLLLAEFVPQNTSYDKFALLDFITTYGKCFGISNLNLNGNSEYKFSEYARRRELVINAINQLVLRGLLLPKANADGLVFFLSSSGKAISLKLNSKYSDMYITAAKCAIAFVKDRTEKQIADMVQKKAMSSLQGEE